MFTPDQRINNFYRDHAHIPENNMMFARDVAYDVMKDAIQCVNQAQRGPLVENYFEGKGSSFEGLKVSTSTKFSSHFFICRTIINSINNITAII